VQECPALWITDWGMCCPDNNQQHGIPAMHLTVLKQDVYSKTESNCSIKNEVSCCYFLFVDKKPR
jgi:hypothetical protein